MKLDIHCVLHHLLQQNIISSHDEPEYIDNKTYEIRCFINKTPIAVMSFFVQIKNSNTHTAHVIQDISLEHFAQHFNFSITTILSQCKV